MPYRRRVSVVGAGVIGLSIAHEFARRGDAVTVVAEQAPEQSVSAVAAAVWFPYAVGQSPAMATWLSRALVRFAALATDDATGVDLRTGTVVERTASDRSWIASVSEHHEARPDELPAGALSGVRATVPVITMQRYLPWLRTRVEELAVRFVAGTVATVDELADTADLVVVAAGLGSGRLGSDDSMYPIRGQVVRLANPAALTEWITDDDNPAGLTYVVARRDDIVCGGVAEVGSWKTDVDLATEAAILQRCRALVPALADLAIVSRAVGLRPARPTIRLEPVDGYAVPVIACYGHGGAGVTLSWGCAEAVAELAG